MSKGKTTRFAQILKDNHYSFDVMKGKKRGQIIFSIDVTKESRNKKELRKLIHSLKSNLNRKQMEHVDEKIVQSKSSEIVNELIQCYEKSKRQADDKHTEKHDHRHHDRDDQKVDHKHHGRNYHKHDDKLDHKKHDVKHDHKHHDHIDHKHDDKHSVDTVHFNDEDISVDSYTNDFRWEKNEEKKIHRKHIPRDEIEMKRERRRRHKEWEKEKRKKWRERKKEEKKRVREEIHRIKRESKIRLNEAKRESIETNHTRVDETGDPCYEELRNLYEEIKFKLYQLENKQEHAKKHKTSRTISDDSDVSEIDIVKTISHKKTPRRSKRVEYITDDSSNSSEEVIINSIVPEKKESKTKRSHERLSFDKLKPKKKKSSHMKKHKNKSSSIDSSSKSSSKPKKVKVKKIKSKEKVKPKKKVKKKKMKVNYALISEPQPKTAFQQSRCTKSTKLSITFFEHKNDRLITPKVEDKNTITEALTNQQTNNTSEFVSKTPDHWSSKTVPSQAIVNEGNACKKDRKYSSDELICSESLQTFISKLL